MSDERYVAQGVAVAAVSSARTWLGITPMLWAFLLAISFFLTYLTGGDFLFLIAGLAALALAYRAIVLLSRGLVWAVAGGGGGGDPPETISALAAGRPDDRIGWLFLLAVIITLMLTILPVPILVPAIFAVCAIIGLAIYARSR